MHERSMKKVSFAMSMSGTLLLLCMLLGSVWPMEGKGCLDIRLLC